MCDLGPFAAESLSACRSGLLSEVKLNIGVAPREEPANERLPSPRAGNAVAAGDAVGYRPEADRNRKELMII